MIGFLKFIPDVLGLIASPVKGWVERKKVKVEGEMRIAEAKTTATIQRIESGDTNAAIMDQISAQNRGWKDDYLLLLTTAPLALLFIGPIFELIFIQTTYTAGGMTDAVMEGFLCLENTPEYYWYALGLIYIDTFGFRRMLRTAVEGWARSKFGSVL